MKNSLLFRIILACFFPVLILSSCKSPEPVVEEHYLKLSDSAVTLQGDEGVLSATIKVYAVPNDWTATPNASWLKVINPTSNSFDILAQANTTGADRVAQVSVKVGDGEMEEILTVNQLAETYTFHRFHNMFVFQGGTMMSISGKYAGAFYSEYPEGSNELQYVPVIIDLETDEWYELGPYPKSLIQLLQPGAIADDGTFIIATEAGGNAKFDLEGNFEYIPAPAGFTAKPEIAGISADGTWVGWSGKQGVSYPFKWVDGVGIELPKPEKNFRDEPIGDVQARGISAAGTIIYGTTWDNEDYGMIYWDENNVVRYVGEDVHEIREVDRSDGYGGTYKYNLANGIWTTDTRYNVSPNGKWIAGIYGVESLVSDAEGERVVRANYPAFYNTETQETTIFEELAGGGGICVTNDGIGFTVDDTFAPNSGKVVNIETKTVYGSCLEWIKEEFGIYVGSGYIQYFPENGEVVLGAGLIPGAPTLEGGNWLITPAR